MSASNDEHDEAMKRKYAEMFAVMEGYRWSLRELRGRLNSDDANKIESEVREKIRKQREKNLIRGNAMLQEWEREEGK